MPHFAKYDSAGNIQSYGRTDIASFNDRVKAGEKLQIIPPEKRGGVFGSPPPDFDITNKVIDGEIVAKTTAEIEADKIR